jgi:hypothetical protein
VLHLLNLRPADITEKRHFPELTFWTLCWWAAASAPPLFRILNPVDFAPVSDVK